MRTAAIMSLALLGLCCPAARADRAPDPSLDTARQALAQTEAVRLSQWAYSVTSIVDGRKTVTKHDPAALKENRWQLVLKDGRKPSDQDLKKYQEERRHRGSGDQRPQLRELIDAASLRVLSNDVTRLTCAFRLKADDPDSRPMVEKVQGTLVVLKDPPTVETIELANVGRISKGAVFSMSEFKMGIQFRRDPVRGDPLPVMITSRVRGRALLFKSLNTDVSTTYGDFRWVGP